MDRKKDKFLTDIFNSLLKGKTVLTSKQEERLYERYWGKLMAVAQRYVSDRESAREIVNDSFVKAFDKLSTFKGKGKGKDTAIVFQAWLVRITVNTAIDRYRADISLTKVLSLDELYNHPTVEMDDRLQLEDILMLLHKLSDLYRIVFNLYELEGYSHEEIGKMLEISTSSSRVYLAKAKQELRILYHHYFGGLSHG